MFVLMTMLVIFAGIAKGSSTTVALPGLVFVWFALVMVMAVSTVLFGSVFFRVPTDLRYLLGSPPPSSDSVKLEEDAKARVVDIVDQYSKSRLKYALHASHMKPVEVMNAYRDANHSLSMVQSLLTAYRDTGTNGKLIASADEYASCLKSLTKDLLVADKPAVNQPMDLILNPTELFRLNGGEHERAQAGAALGRMAVCVNVEKPKDIEAESPDYVLPGPISSQ